MGSIFYIPLYLQVVDGMSATGAGMRFIPVMVCSVADSLFGGKVMQRTGRYYWLTIWCLALGVLGAVVIFPCSGIWGSWSWGVIRGLGIGAFGGGAAVTTTLINVIANVDPKDQAIATACTYLFRSLGSVVGVSRSGTIVQQTLRNRLRAGLESGEEADEIMEKRRQSLGFIAGLKPGVRTIVRGCYQEAANAAFGMAVVVICAALGSACFIREKRLSRN